MLQTIKWFFGQPVVNRARRLARAFLDQTLHVPAVQRQLLLDQIARNADSQFGRDHHFREIRTPDDFRRQVPVCDYDRHEPYIDRVRQGDIQALFGAGTRVLM
ncbi:MAG: GH3 family domain-containing protein, partial [Isosphaeraceae bacterium]